MGRRRRKEPEPADPGDQRTATRVVVEPRAPVGVRRAGAALACVYLLAVWGDGAGWSWPGRILPLPVRFFTQAAELFPRAASAAVEWRAEAWRCDLRRFEEIDVRPFFPIRADDKESRFYRAMFFHHRQPQVTRALDEFIVKEHNRRHPEQRIGGVMLISLLVPIPAPGTPERRYQPLPISQYPSTVKRNRWYIPPADLRRSRCGESP